MVGSCIDPQPLARGITGVAQRIGLLAQIHATAVEACRLRRASLMIKRWDTPVYSRAVRDVDHVKEGVMRQHGEQFVDGER